MTGYFFHCQHKCRTHGEKKNSQQIAEGWKRTLCTRCWRFYWCRHHQRFVYLDWRVFPPPRLRFIFSRYSLFFSLFRQFAHLRNSWLVLLIFLCSLFLFLIFFSRLLFTYFLANHRARSFCTIHFFAYSSSKIWRLFFGIVFTFFLFYVPHALYRCCIWFTLFRVASFIYVYVALFRLSFHFYFVSMPKFRALFSLMVCLGLVYALFFSSVCLFNNKICCRALILRQSCRCQKAFNASHTTAAGLTVKRIINVFTDDFLFFFSILVNQQRRNKEGEANVRIF